MRRACVAYACVGVRARPIFFLLSAGGGSRVGRLTPLREKALARESLAYALRDHAQSWCCADGWPGFPQENFRLLTARQVLGGAGGHYRRAQGWSGDSTADGSRPVSSERQSGSKGAVPTGRAGGGITGEAAALAEGPVPRVMPAGHSKEQTRYAP